MMLIMIIMHHAHHVMELVITITYTINPSDDRPIGIPISVPCLWGFAQAAFAPANRSYRNRTLPRDQNQPKSNYLSFVNF
jgi:hypothetical protein